MRSFCDDISKGFRTSNISAKYHQFLDDYHVIQDWMYYSLCFDFWIDKKLQFNIHYGVFTNIIGLPGYREQNMSKIKKRYHVMKDVTHL